MFIDDDRGDPSLFAHRVLVPIGADSNGVNQVAWLKAIGTGRQRRFVAVGSGEDLELPPAEASRAGSGTDVQPGQKHGQDGHTTSPAEGSAGGAGSTSGPLAGITYACHLVFDLGDLSPTTAMLQFLVYRRRPDRRGSGQRPGASAEASRPHQVGEAATARGRPAHRSRRSRPRSVCARGQHPRHRRGERRRNVGLRIRAHVVHPARGKRHPAPRGNGP